MGYKLNGCDTEGLPVYLIKNLLEHADIPFFIETGTAGGDSVLKAAELFRWCYTIELIEGRAPKAGPENIIWLTGSSPALLHAIIDEISYSKNDAFFWLDAHYSDPTPNTTGHKECPLMEELQVISRYHEHAIIFIDDARLFYGHPPAPLDPREWPRVQDIFCVLKEKFPLNISTITDDYIISVPERMCDYVNAEWRGRFSIRYPNAYNKLKSQVQDVYHAFKNYLQ